MRDFLSWIWHWNILPFSRSAADSIDKLFTSFPRRKIAPIGYTLVCNSASFHSFLALKKRKNNIRRVPQQHQRPKKPTQKEPKKIFIGLEAHTHTYLCNDINVDALIWSLKWNRQQLTERKLEKLNQLTSLVNEIFQKTFHETFQIIRLNMPRNK